MISRLCALVCLSTMTSVALAQGPVLAATPPMGWNSWNWFAEKVTDKDVRQAADLLVSSGMRDAGYVYVNIDDTWEGERDAAGALHTNAKFPDMKALADYVHSKGLKLGIYSSPGSKTCARFEGSYGHEQQDADLYASWGIDFLKYDLCSFHRQMGEMAPGTTDEAKLKQDALMREAYAKMHRAILKTGRPMVYSLCQYGHDSGWQWAAEVGGNLWRTTGDINPSFDRISLIGREQAGLAKYAGPGHWKRSGHAGGRQRKADRGRKPHAHGDVGDARGSAAGGQQPQSTDAGGGGDPDQSQRDRDRPGPAGTGSGPHLRRRTGRDMVQAARRWRTCCRGLQFRRGTKRFCAESKRSCRRRWATLRP